MTGHARRGLRGSVETPEPGQHPAGLGVSPPG